MLNVITPNVISAEYFMRLELRSVYDLDYFGVQIIESVIFLLHFQIPDPNQGIEIYKQFWLGTISLLHLSIDIMNNPKLGGKFHWFVCLS